MKSEKMMDVICEEIDKIAEKGLTTQNLETAYKLIDMYKDLKTVEGMDDWAEEEYSQARGRYAKRDSMGRYARNDGRMMSYNRGNSYADGMGNYSEKDTWIPREHIAMTILWHQSRICLKIWMNSWQTCMTSSKI